MDDNTRNLGQYGATVRVSQELLDSVEAERNRRERPRPTRGDLLAEAWEFYTKSREGTRGSPTDNLLISGYKTEVESAEDASASVGIPNTPSSNPSPGDARMRELAAAVAKLAEDTQKLREELAGTRSGNPAARTSHQERTSGRRRNH